MTENHLSKSPFRSAFEARDDLGAFGNDALLLFALQLKFDIEDIPTLAATSLTDGSDDKQADLVYVDLEQGHAVIAQTYMRQNVIEGEEAPAKKASDLNTAVSWLLSRPLNELPGGIKSQAQELREGITDGSVKSIYVWYVHNLYESTNVKNELTTVEHTLKNAISGNFPNAAEVIVQAQEVGVNTIAEWYEAISTPILVTEEFKIPISGGFEIANSDWSAYVTSIPAKWLYDLFQKHKDKLFSANVRGYLGSRNADANINNGIKGTAQDEPGHFWVYNNGITVLVHEFGETDGGTHIRVRGISIVNGAQTTGAIGNLNSPPKDEARILVRFVTCTKPEIVDDIVRFNNSQNKITAPDFRSRDSIQRRLQNEFRNIPLVEYLPRRGGHADAIKRRPNALASITAGQALAAFHGNPEVAYHQKTGLWENNNLYSQYFTDATDAYHIVFAYSLLRAVERKKAALVDKSKHNTTTHQEQAQLSFFRMRGSTFLMASAIAECIEIFLGNQVPNRFRLHFRNNLSPENAVNKWADIVEVASSFSEYLQDGLSDGIKNQTKVKQAISVFTTLVNATKQVNTLIYTRFGNEVVQ